MTDDTNPLEKIIVRFADRLRDAPGAKRLQRLAKSAAHIPGPLLDDLTVLVAQIDDPEFIGDDVALALIDIAFCDERCADAVDFASTLRARLRRYVREPRVAEVARREHRERIAWWKMALTRAAELSVWPAVVLIEMCSRA